MFKGMKHVKCVAATHTQEIIQVVDLYCISLKLLHMKIVHRMYTRSKVIGNHLRFQHLLCNVMNCFIIIVISKE